MEIKRIHILLIAFVPVLIVAYLMIIRPILQENLRPFLPIVLDFLYPAGFTIPFPYNLLGLFLVIPGFILVAWANYNLLQKISWTEREPFHTPSALVVEGPYKYSRNPVYLEVITLFTGIGMILGSWTFIMANAAVFIVFRFFIRWEEKKLEETFGEEYLEFKKRVRRWL